MGDVTPVDLADISARVDRREMADARRQLLQYRRRGARGFTASASRIDPTDSKQVEAAKRRRSAWTTEAWNYYDSVGEAKYGARFKGRALAKLRLLPAWLSDDRRPVSLDEAQENGAPITNEEIALCHAAVDRMAAADGSHYPLLYSYGVTMFVAGDGYLAGFPDEDGVETWGFYSTDELHPGTTGGSEWVITPSPDATAEDQIPVPADALVLRIWQAHPRFSSWADSALRGVLDVCQEIHWLTRLSVGTAQSRLPAGMMIFPDTMLGHTEREVDGTADGEAQNNPFVDDLLRHTETAIQRPDSAESAVPFFTFADAEDIAAIRQFEFGRPFDETSIARMRLARERFAAGVDLPPSIILGTADVNHWNVWQIDEQTFNMHVEPDAIEFVSGVTAGYFRPALLAAGLNPSLVKRMAVWYDETDLVTKPNLGDAADDAWDRITISDSEYRRTKGFSDTSAPDDEEYRRRAFLKTGEVILKDEDLNVAVPVEPTPPVTPVEAIPTPGAEEGTPSEPGPPPEPMLAAATRPSQAERLTAAALRWQALDRILTAKLLVLANTTLARSLEKAGARLRSRVAKDRASPGADIARNTSNALLAATLGPGLVAAVVDPPELLDSFEELGSEFDRLTRRVQAQVRRDMAAILEWSDDDEEALAVRQDEDRRRAAAVFVTGIAAIAAVRLFDPSPNAPPLGEVDSDSIVPPGIIRQSMAIAGGAPAELTPSYSVFVPGGILPGELDTIRPGVVRTSADDLITVPEAAITDPVPGVAQGLSTFDTISVALPVLQYRYRWNYGDEGDRTRPFEPHVDLSDVEFASWEDPVLSNPDLFPDDAFYRPGDHAGCFPAGTVVSGPAARGATLRWYEGEMVEVAFASGEFFTATANHPVLTPDGWVPAGSLHEGSDVARCVDAHAVSGLVPDEHQIPAKIEDVVASFRVAPGVVAGAVPVAAEDFHGDGAGSEVAVVWTDSGLVSGRDAEVSEPVREALLVLGDELPRVLPGDGGSAERLVTVGAPALPGVSERGETHPFLGAAAASENELRLAPTARVDPGSGETVPDRAAVHSESLGECLDGFTGLVQLDQVVKVNRSTVSCHVYNLQTRYGWYIADGILVHNCLCDFETIFEDPTGDEEAPSAEIEEEPGL